MLAVALFVIVALDIVQRTVAAVVEVTTPVKWLLQVIAIGYVFFLIAWPFGPDRQETFKDGFAR